LAFVHSVGIVENTEAVDVAISELTLVLETRVRPQVGALAAHASVLKLTGV